jgi:hypothetical protein
VYYVRRELEPARSVLRALQKQIAPARPQCFAVTREEDLGGEGEANGGHHILVSSAAEHLSWRRKSVVRQTVRTRSRLAEGRCHKLIFGFLAWSRGRSPTLLERGAVSSAWIVRNGENAIRVAMLAPLPMPVPRFGSSDCARCRSHLKVHS